MRGKSQDGCPLSIVRQKRYELQSNALSPSQHLRKLIEHEQNVRQITPGCIRYAWWLLCQSNDLHHLRTFPRLTAGMQLQGYDACQSIHIALPAALEIKDAIGYRTQMRPR
jgi:hypothetical protein